MRPKCVGLDATRESTPIEETRSTRIWVQEFVSKC